MSRLDQRLSIRLVHRRAPTYYYFCAAGGAAKTLNKLTTNSKRIQGANENMFKTERGAITDRLKIAVGSISYEIEKHDLLNMVQRAAWSNL